MRIAVVTATFPPYYGGAGNVAYHNARLLWERGHQITVFTLARAGGMEISAPFPVEYLRPLLAFGNAGFAPSLSRRLRGYDLIHLHYPFIFGAEMVLAAARRWHIPIMVTYHNRLEETQPIKRALFRAYNRTMEPLVLSWASVIVSVSHDHFRYLFPGVPDVEVPNGVDTTNFAPGKRLVARQIIGPSTSDPIVLFVGALDRAHRFKNVPALLKALAALPHITGIIAGDGNLRQEFVTLASRLGIGSRVRFVGSLTTDELAIYYRAADVTVLPSSATESFGMVLVESMACGTPVVASDLPGVREVVLHKKTGLLTTPGSVPSLHNGIEWMVRHKEEREAMGRAGREHVVSKYSWDVIARNLEDACRVAAASPTSGFRQGVFGWR